MKVEFGSAYLVPRATNSGEVEMKLFKKSHDGGKDSGVTGYWLIEWKRGFSIVLLRFSKGSREAFHNHAFNAFTIWLKGKVVEETMLDESGYILSTPWEALQWKFTKREDMHRIVAQKTSWAISFRGPWTDTWKERKANDELTLTHGRHIIDIRPVG